MTDHPITPGQAPGHLTDEQAKYFALGWNSHQDACCDDAAELLEALKAVLGEWREGYGLNCVEQVRAAVTKAERRRP